MNPPVIPSWSGVRACVIGGTGFLGFQVVKCLRARGAVVRVMALPPAADHPIRQFPDVELLSGDIRDPAAVAKAVAGCRVMFQTAGPVSVGAKDRDARLDPHVSGTRCLLENLPPGCRLVHTSSLVAVGGTPDGRVLDEGSPFPNAGVRIGYVAAKRAAEEIAFTAAKSGADVVVTNPGYMIGPEDFGGSVMGKFCTRFWRGRVPVAPPGGFNLVDVRDVADGHVLAAECGRAGGRYILGGENQSLVAFEHDLAAAAGFRPRWLPTCPGWLYRLFAVGAEARGRLTGKEPYPSLEHVRLNRLYWYATSAKAERELGYRARPVAESAADAFRWHAARQTLRPRGVNGWLLRPA